MSIASLDTEAAERSASETADYGFFTRSGESDLTLAGWRGEPGNGFLTLTGDGSTGYTLTDKQGNVSEFDTDGLLTARRDRLETRPRSATAAGSSPRSSIRPGARPASATPAGGYSRSPTSRAA